MFDLLPIVISLLLVDALNPVLLAATVYAVGTDRPYANSLSLLAAHTVAYFAAGIVIALGIDRIMDYLANPTPIDFVIQLLLGVGMIIAGIRSRDGSTAESKQPPGALTPGSAIAYGVLLTVIGVPFALPYFAVLDQFLKVELSWQWTLLLLGAYNLFYVLPFLLVPAALAVLGDSSRALFQHISEWVDRVAGWILPKALVLLGLALIVDAAVYFGRGTPLF